MNRSAVVFPGQGSQAVGMGRAAFDSSPRARGVFERANEILGFDLARMCFEGPAAELEKTDIQQPAIFVVSAALWEALVDAGVDRAQFTVAGGLSLGEYTALFAAGAFSFEDGLRLVRRRGQLMQEAAHASPSGMLSLIGADEAAARSLCDRAREGDVLAPANFNCPGQIVISGSRTAIERAQRIAEEVGCRAVALPVAGAFHSPLMEPAAAQLATVLSSVDVRSPRIPVIANVDGGYHRDPSTIRESMRRQVTHPVLWQKCVERLQADGVTQFVEVGPGRVLTGLLRKIDRRAAGVSVQGPEDMAALSPAVTG